jgi:hypothetical protein
VLAEAEWQRTVVDCATRFGWRHWHDYDSVRNAPGFPDLVLVRDRSLIFAELKTQTGRVSPEQRQWIEALLTVERGVVEASEGAEIPFADLPSVEARVWRPSDWLDVLARLSEPRGSVRTAAS